MAERQEPGKHHVGPIRPDMTEAELTELGGQLFDKITEREPSEDHEHRSDCAVGPSADDVGPVPGSEQNA